MGGFDVSLIGLRGMPIVDEGDDVAALLLEAVARAGTELRDQDVVVVASTVVAKAQGRFFTLAEIEPSPAAIELATIVKKDPRLVELVLRESSDVVRAVPNVLIVRHKLGFVSANAGIDFSNVRGPGDVGVLLPEDPDGAARDLRDALCQASGASELAVVISDTHGRAFRKGNVNVAIGVAGMPPVVDERGEKDLLGRVLEATVVPLADVVASAAGLVTGEVDEGIPAVLVRGLRFSVDQAGASTLNWLPGEDLFAR